MSRLRSVASEKKRSKRGSGGVVEVWTAATRSREGVEAGVEVDYEFETPDQGQGHHKEMEKQLARSWQHQCAIDSLRWR